jgi:pimeloyl-ACP methyl ester carboxylesterase
MRSPLASAIALGIFLALAIAQAAIAADWHDPSPHKVQFVPVAENVRLEVLDWGGSGTPILLLAASGDTAHEFDDFAPKLTAHHHVYAITRRGYGASGFDPEKYGVDLLGDDVVAVMDALKIDRVILAGHSFAGAELSDVATRHPGRVTGLIYLEAAYSFGFRSDEAPSMEEFQQVVRSPKTPPPQLADLANFHTLQDYQERMIGVRLPEAELRQEWTQTPDGGVGSRRTFPGSATLTKGARAFPYIPLPALVIFANPHGLGSWLETNPDPSVQAAVKTYAAAYEDYTKRQAKAVAAGMPRARVITVPSANHFVFISNEAEVLREMNVFMAGLPRN